jgi:hypothetical protein
MLIDKRMIVCASCLAVGLAARAAVEIGLQAPRPALKSNLSTLPLQIGDWIGRNVPLDPRIEAETQSDDYVNRVYEDVKNPGRKLVLWVNYSRLGLNLRHSPEVCLPSGGWTKIESASKPLEIKRPERPPFTLFHLGYSQGELVQRIGFWYYVFGEGSMERFVRALPITSRSSHGRATRGSGMTVELFMPGLDNAGEEAIIAFARSLLGELEPLLPDEQAQYFIP